MSVFVDDMRMRTRVGHIVANWSHLWADTVPELEEFAERLGLNPKWIQTSNNGLVHYDVVDWRREEAIKLGAIPLHCGSDQWLEIVRQCRANHREGRA